MKRIDWFWFIILLGAALALAAFLDRATGAPPVLPPLGLPVTAARVELGRKLFFDTRLSSDNRTACATCHDPNKGWADKNMVAVGSFGRRGTRNSPTIINSVYSPLMFHDGREIGQPAQSLLPLGNRLEMGDQDEDDVMARLRAIPGYAVLFAQAYGLKPFPQSPVDKTRFSHALASFESTIVSFDAPIDKRLEGKVHALRPQAEIGFGLMQAARCFECHKAPQFSDFMLRNNGMEFAMGGRDLGRAAVVQASRARPADIRAFKTATLREIHRTAPYNHAGTMLNLAAVVRHYNRGGARADGLRDPFIDPRIRPQGWNLYQEQCVVRALEEAFGSEAYPYVTRPVLP